MQQLNLIEVGRVSDGSLVMNKPYPEGFVQAIAANIPRRYGAKTLLADPVKELLFLWTESGDLYRVEPPDDRRVFRRMMWY